MKKDENKKEKPAMQDAMTGLRMLECPKCGNPIGSANLEWRTFDVAGTKAGAGEVKATVGLVGCGKCFAIVGSSVVPQAETRIEITQPPESIPNACARCKQRPAETTIKAVQIVPLQPPQTGIEMKPVEVKLCRACHDITPHNHITDHA